MHVLVTGATGFVGGRLVPALLDAGHDVRALVRDRESYDPPEGVTVAEGDLLEPGGFESALDDVDAAYYLVHLGGPGVERGDLSEHLRSRREVEAVLADGDYDLTVLRAAIIIGAGSASFEMVRQLASRLPVMVTPRWVQNECQPIAIDDVTGYLVGVLETPETAPGTYEIGGPNVLTYAEIMRQTARVVRGFAPLILSVPVLTPRLSSYWVGLVTDVDWRVARPLIDGLKTPVVVENDEIRDLVAVELTPYKTAVKRAINNESPEADDG
jgi:uncharacterized protein YbjT (DUF2867 family)